MMNLMNCALLTVVALMQVGLTFAQEPVKASLADLAFEQQHWEVAIDEYQKLLSNDTLNGVYWLRIAQAQRGLGDYVRALDTLERARVVQGPEAMVELERARNLAGLDRAEEAFVALQSADEAELRSLSVLDDSEEFKHIRLDDRFQRLYRSVRRRIYPCEAITSTHDFDFWTGTWDVRLANGSLIGRNTISKQNGGCTILEQWEGGGGSTGSSTSFYVPSRGLWRQVWVGSGGTLIDVAGETRDGSMHMEGTIEYVGLTNSVVALRGNWTVLPDGRVRQLFEEFDIGTNTWQTWFDGYYELVDRL
mgnify:CR=1 FL=1|jgi:hypothetical protein